MTKPTKKDNTIKNKSFSTLHLVQPKYCPDRFAIRGSNTYNTVAIMRKNQKEKGSLKFTENRG